MPAQCPECGRFLKKDLVESLSAGPAPCPKCEAELTATMFDEAVAAEAGASVTEVVTVEHDAASVETTVLRAHTPDEVAAAAEAASDGPVAAEAPDRDPLDGWDRGTEGLVGLGGQHEHDIRLALEPQQAVAAGVVGALVGALVSRRTGRGALLGALLAILAGAIARAIGESRELR